MQATNNEASGREHGEEGILLIELLIGTVCIVIALTAVMSVVITASMMRRQAAELSLAYNAASNALEELRTMPADELPIRDSADFDCPALNGGIGGLQALPHDKDNLPGEVSVMLDTAGDGARVYRVTAQVDWAGVRGPQRLRLESLISDRTTH